MARLIITILGTLVEKDRLHSESSIFSITNAEDSFIGKYGFWQLQRDGYNWTIMRYLPYEPVNKIVNKEI